MRYLIYFDEANKIDQPGKSFSYYGAYGGDAGTIVQVIKSVRRIYKALNTKSEMHFREYSHDQYIKKYFSVLHHVINQDVKINILIVNNEDAQNIANQMSMNVAELRQLFYIKIPERLFYGITRQIEEQSEVKIIVDRSDEYDALRLYSKVKEQMNAHSVYRDKKYKITSVVGQDSKKSIPLQIIDTFMGMVVFLMEKTYLQTSDSAAIKSDLVYRFLIEGSNLQRFQQQIKLYKWAGKEELTDIPISEYVSEFIVFKTQYDIKQLTSIQNKLIRNPDISTKDLRQEMSYKNTQLRMLLGYKDEIEGRGRNYSLFQQKNK